jgi:hypothetical protein
MISVSRSAIGFPDEGIGLNRCLRALGRRADRPRIDRHSLPDARNPGSAQTFMIDGEELRRGYRNRQPPPVPRCVFADDHSSADVRRISSKPPTDLRVEAHDPDRPRSRRKIQENSATQPNRISPMRLQFKEQGDPAANHLE